jgi:hypothetical protein
MVYPKTPPPDPPASAFIRALGPSLFETVRMVVDASAEDGVPFSEAQEAGVMRFARRSFALTGATCAMLAGAHYGKEGFRMLQDLCVGAISADPEMREHLAEYAKALKGTSMQPVLDSLLRALGD